MTNPFDEPSVRNAFRAAGISHQPALQLLGLIVVGIADGNDSQMQAIVAAIAPEPQGSTEPSVAHLIGLSLSLLDTWLGDDARAEDLSRIRVPRWNSRSRAAATDIIALARKGRAFDAIGSLHRTYSGEAILYGSVLAVAATVQTWAATNGQSAAEGAAQALV